MNLKKNNLTSTQPAYSTDLPAASILRLLGAWLYDGMLLCAVWLLAGIIYIIPAQMMVDVDSTTAHSLSTTEFIGPVFYSYLFLITWFFFAWFWTHGGQTLGLKTWSLRLQTSDGQLINWTQSLLRFLVACVPWLAALFLYAQLSKAQLLPSPYLYGVFLIAFSGIFWILIDKKNRSLQDIFSDTRIIKLPKQANKQAKKKNTPVF